MLDRLVSLDLVWRLGWTLLHSLWQLVLLGALASVVVALLSRRSANTRYGVACCGLALFYAPLVATFFLIPPPPAPNVAVVEYLADTDAAHKRGETPSVAPVGPAMPELPTANQNAEFAAASEPSEPLQDWGAAEKSRSTEKTFAWLPWIVGVWAAIFGALSISNLGGWLVVQRLKHTASLPQSNGAGQRLEQLAKHMGVSQVVRLLESAQIDSPLVIGWLRPVVLLPASLITGLSPTELDAVLSHELAHIRRYDYLVNLLQTFTETLLFYHPAVWLLSRRIRIEREYCCDDDAISVCGDKVDYARALAAVEASRHTPQLAMSFLGRNRSMTPHRIRRIMGKSTGLPHAWLNESGVLLVMSATLIALVLTQSVGQAAREKTASEWGEAVEGVRARLRVDKTTWKQGETIAFKADVRNRGGRELLVTLAQQPCEIEFDGKWHKWSGGFSLKSSPLPPGKKSKNVRISLLEPWRSEDGDGLPLTIGKHTVRIAFPARAPNPKAPGAWLQIRAISNPVEIEIVDGVKQTAFEWGEEKHGLKTRLTSRTRVFRAGHSVSMTLEIKNVSDVAQKYGRFSVTRSDEFQVLDESGKRMAYLAGPAQLVVRHVELLPGETQAIAVFDLADSYYLRKPGAYSVQLRGRSLPPSGTLRFEITPDRAAVGDPIGPLLSLTKKNWRFEAPAGRRERSPGANWQSTNCRLVTFRLNPPTSKVEHDFVHLHLADQAAKEQPAELAVESSRPSAEHLGKISHWHVYFQATDGALKAWPTAKSDIAKTLKTIKVANGGQQVRQRHDPFAALVERLNARHGLWNNGSYSPIQMGEYASVKEILERATANQEFDDGKISSYRVLETRKLELNDAPAGYRAALISSNLGPKILVFKYEGEQRWWSRFYDGAAEPRPAERARKQRQEAIDQAALDKLVSQADLIADIEIVSESKSETGEETANYLCKVALLRVFKTKQNVQSPVAVNIVRLENEKLAYSLPIKKGVVGTLFLKLHPIVLNPPYITTDNHTGILESTPALHEAIQASLRKRANDGSTDVVRDGNITWRRQGKEKHVWVTEVTDEILAKLSEDQEITHLSLASDPPNGNRITGPGVPDNRPMMTDTGLKHISRMGNLRMLSLPHECKATDDGLVHLQELQNLRELWLDFIPFTDAGVVHLKNLTKLRVLRFYQARITDKGMESMRGMLDLEDLQLGDSLVTDRSMPIIGKMTKLKTLDLRARVTDKGLVHLQGLTNLTWLALSDNKIGDEGMPHVRKLRNLEWLMLENTDVTDAGLAEISSLPNLTTLYLTGTRITDAGMNELAKLPKLQRLQLNQTRIGDLGLRKLATMKNLRDVEVRQTLVTPYGIRAAKDAVPELRIAADVKPAPKNLLRNGGFETPDNRGAAYRPYSRGQLGGWTVASGSVDIVGSYWKPASGRQSLDLSGLQELPGTIQQDVATTSGKNYLIRFSAAGNPEPDDIANPKVMNVFWNDRKIATLKLSARGHDFDNVGWQIYEFEVQATGPTSRLKFQSLTNTPCGPVLDDVSVTPLGAEAN